MDCLFHRVISFIVLVSLAGCSHALTYDYLMLHPDLLQKKYAACEINFSVDCEMIRQAATDYTQMLREREYDPTAFGLKIMQAQQRLVDLRLTRKQAELSGDKKILEMTDEAYAAEYQKIQEFYTIVAGMHVN